MTLIPGFKPQDVKPEPVRLPLTILYKNGLKVQAEAEEFKIDHGTWSWKNMSPNPLIIGVDEIMAVYEGHV